MPTTRHGWINDAALEQLAEHRAAFCIYELGGYLSPLDVTTDFVYVRLHGPNGAYSGRYEDASLHRWAERVGEWRGRGLDCRCFFDNDEAGHAVGNALTLRGLLDLAPNDRGDD